MMNYRVKGICDAYIQGSECEYRHSEMARLNPRDCCYWLSGSCLNPPCAFRHPTQLQAVQFHADSVPRSPHVSSPGFDVLVDNGSEELVYDDDYNYIIDHDGDSGEATCEEYDLKENARDDPEYIGSSLFYEKERHDYEYHFGAPHSLDHVREGPPSSRRRVLDRVVPARRRHSPKEQAYNGHHSVYLPDRLKRRQMNDDRSHNAYSERLASSHPINRTRERPQYQVEHHPRRSMELHNLGSHRGHEGRFRRSSFDRFRFRKRVNGNNDSS
ncbi:hypothetical protein LIER_04370 [Lithospermum erythrorhizon]|uniref:C3H1-type domain-containing protein n=1 Tax=Lithospermum erythrorhizon TaxID=34254 RepID=A0AAV3NY41_LITER